MQKIFNLTEYFPPQKFAGDSYAYECETAKDAVKQYIKEHYRNHHKLEVSAHHHGVEQELQAKGHSVYSWQIITQSEETGFTQRFVIHKLSDQTQSHD